MSWSALKTFFAPSARLAAARLRRRSSRDRSTPLGASSARPACSHAAAESFMCELRAERRTVLRNFSAFRLYRKFPFRSAFVHSVLALRRSPSRSAARCSVSLTCRSRDDNGVQKLFAVVISGVHRRSSDMFVRCDTPNCHGLSISLSDLFVLFRFARFRRRLRRRGQTKISVERRKSDRKKKDEHEMEARTQRAPSAERRKDE